MRNIPLSNTPTLFCTGATLLGDSYSSVDGGGGYGCVKCGSRANAHYGLTKGGKTIDTNELYRSHRRSTALLCGISRNVFVRNTRITVSHLTQWNSDV